ncbi:MAG: hypothetical protein NC084_08160 [Bacteroides sp.]|nr:hypothetical protein [Eubacterium sp.]MCM1418615.1 hypothetical protein [Roseburia sp.]MCM1462669.1 hypothetical protein [Bacteroides sp.]
MTGGVIKGGYGYGYVPVSTNDDAPVMRTVYGVHSEAVSPLRTVSGECTPIDEPFLAEELTETAEAEIAEDGAKAAPSPNESEEETAEEEKPTAQIEPPKPEPPAEPSIDRVSPEEAALERSKLVEEYEALREQYEQEAELFITRAKEKAEEIYEKTKAAARETVEKARAEGERIKAESKVEGKKQGYDEGYTQGHEEGYVSALKKCKETLVALKAEAESVTAQKEQIFLEYEHALFDTIFEIAQKVTLGSLKQKDKAVITKMLRAAGKRYRSAKNIKITLSQLDISEEAEIDEALLKEIFRSDALIEIELLKDAPQGTLLIDSGSEITDAGVSTQLKMIEQLGKRKYRDQALTDLLQAKRAKPQDEETDAEAEEGGEEA